MLICNQNLKDTSKTSDWIRLNKFVKQMSHCQSPKVGHEYWPKGNSSLFSIALVKTEGFLERSFMRNPFPSDGINSSSSLRKCCSWFQHSNTYFTEQQWVSNPKTKLWGNSGSPCLLVYQLAIFVHNTLKNKLLQQWNEHNHFKHSASQALVSLTRAKWQQPQAANDITLIVSICALQQTKPSACSFRICGTYEYLHPQQVLLLWLLPNLGKQL